MLPPDNIRMEVLNAFRGKIGCFGYVLGMIVVSITIPLILSFPSFMEENDLDWIYKWFTESAWNNQSFYIIYFFLGLVVLHSIFQFIGWLVSIPDTLRKKFETLFCSKSEKLYLTDSKKRSRRKKPD